MNITLVLMLLAAILLPIAVKLIKKEIPIHVIGMMMGAFVLLACIGFWAGKAQQTLDVEVMNGEVISKRSEHVSCEHSYSCNCRSVQSCSGSGQHRSCSTSTVCDTCYEHSYDVDWKVKANIGEVNISRIDRQGIHTPPRWSAVAAGEPFAKEHFHTNYVKAVPDSIFNTAQNIDKSKFVNMIPAYPHNVFDYYRLNRALTVGVNVPDIQQWSNDISTILKQLGPQKQANIIVVFVKTTDPQYEFALRSAWLGAKKNDVVILIGTENYPKLDWVRILSWTDSELFKIQLRDDLQEFDEIDRVSFMSVIAKNISQSFKRKSMKDFQYLENEINPPNWVVAITLSIMILISGVIFVKSSSFGTRPKYGRIRRKF